MDEIIVFFMREFGWSLEYTTNLVKTLPIKRLNALIEEVRYQKAMEDYRQASCSAMIVACLVSDKAHRRNVKDIIGYPPQRRVSKKKLSTIAQKQGINIPKE